MKVQNNPAVTNDAASQKKQAAKGLKSSGDSQQDIKSKTDAYTLDIKSQTTTTSSSITTESQATQAVNDLKENMLKNPTLSFNSMTFDTNRVSALLGAIAADQAA
ncbi:MAG: hypothetical protein HQK88_06780 [Nitrospirae bacterium]|nr:hypothetical protein [Nitrospirota bacterium]MBF0536613.1 hypothetical protein [Nitrospirota bacterium]MBF0616506.1 hypothetical protein [Nitrospirota bacterium]